MERNKFTTDENGFNFMANTGQEEQDRDTVGIIFAVVLMALTTFFQYAGLL